MIFKRLIFIFFVLFFSSCSHNNIIDKKITKVKFPTQSFVKVFWKYDNQEVKTGSGFIIYQGRRGSNILTASHVCKEPLNLKLQSVLNKKPLEITVSSLDGKQHEADIMLFEDKYDICLVYAKKMIEYPSVPISKKLPEVGDRIYIIGSPMGFSSYYDKMVPIVAGTYSGFYTMRHPTAKPGDKKNKTQIYSLDVHKGNSGSMIINEDGEVVGIMTYIVKLGSDYQFITGGATLPQIQNFVTDFVNE